MKDTVRVEKLYVESERLISQVCFEFHTKWNIDLSDLKGCADLIFMEAVQLHEKDRGEFSTLLVRMLKTRLQSEVRRELTHRTYKDSSANAPPRVCRDNTRFIDLLCDMGEDAKTILHVVSDPPSDVQKEPQAARGYRFFWGAVKRHLRNERGWSFYRIRRALGEVRHAVRSTLST